MTWLLVVLVTAGTLLVPARGQASYAMDYQDVMLLSMVKIINIKDIVPPSINLAGKLKAANPQEDILKKAHKSRYNIKYFISFSDSQKLKIFNLYPPPPQQMRTEADF